MSELSPRPRAPRPEFRNINAFHDLPSYRWPLASLVSGMHRFSGLILFLLVPFIIWMFDTSLSSEYSFARFSAAFHQGIGWVPGIVVKLLALVLLWAYLHHFFAGVRHIAMDLTHSVSKEVGRKSALTVLSLTAFLTVVLGAKLFGLY